MAAYGSIATATATNGSVTVTKPSGLNAGDLMVAIFSCSSGDPDPSTGWTTVASKELTDSGSIARVRVHAKVADSSDAAATNFTFTCNNGSARAECVLYRLTGTFASAANVYSYSIEYAPESVTDILRAPVGFTPAVAGSLLIMYMRALCDDSDNNSFSNYALQTDDPTWTERADIQDAGGTNSIRIGTATATRTETTATGYFQAAVSTGNVSTHAVQQGLILAIADTQSGTATPSVVTANLNAQAPTPTGTAGVTASVVTTLLTAPTSSAAATEPPWKNADKPSPGTITNQNKP